MKRNLVFILAVFNLLLGGFNIAGGYFDRLWWLSAIGFLTALVGGVYPLFQMVGHVYATGFSEGMTEGAYQFYLQILAEFDKMKKERKPASDRVPDKPTDL